MKFLFLISLLLLVIIKAKEMNASGLNHMKICTKQQIKDAILLFCYSDNPTNEISPIRKRGFSFYPSIDYQKELNFLWRKIFNVNDNTTVSIPEIAWQKQLLFGRCNDAKRDLALKSLIEMHRNRKQNRENKNSQLNNYLNYELNSNEENFDSEYSYKPNNMIRYRREFTDDCCKNTCTLEVLKRYCPSNDPTNNYS